MQKIIFDVQLFFVFLAKSIISLPNLRKEFEEFYKTDNYRFHERITHSTQYDKYNISWGTLESEVAIRRVFGIQI